MATPYIRRERATPRRRYPVRAPSDDKQAALKSAPKPKYIPGVRALHNGLVVKALRQTVPYYHPQKSRDRATYAAYERHVTRLVSRIQGIPVKGYLSRLFRSLALGMVKTEPLLVGSKEMIQVQKEEAYSQLKKGPFRRLADHF